MRGGRSFGCSILKGLLEFMCSLQAKCCSSGSLVASTGHISVRCWLILPACLVIRPEAAHTVSVDKCDLRLRVGGVLPPA